MVDIGYCVPSFMVLSQLVALGVVEEQRAFGAGDLDRGGAVVRIARRQVPAAADR